MSPLRNLDKDERIGGRKGAYVARNRAAILVAAQEVFSKLGPSATIDDLAAAAGMSVSTLYKHFPSKEALFSEAIVDAMQTWEIEIQGQLPDHLTPLQALVLPMRFFVRTRSLYPTRAKLLEMNPGEVLRNLPRLSQGLKSNLQLLVDMGVLDIDNLVLRSQVIESALLVEAIRQSSDPKATPKEGDLVVAYALLTLGINQELALELVSEKIPQLRSKH